MTIGEVKAFKDGELIDERGFVLGIDMSERKDCETVDFTAVTEGVCGISAKLSPRVVIRDYIDGDRAVPVSEWAEVRLKFLVVKGDTVQEKILSAARSGSPLRCVFMSGGLAAFRGNMLISLGESGKGTIFGTEITAVFSAC